MILFHRAVGSDCFPQTIKTGFKNIFHSYTIPFKSNYHISYIILKNAVIINEIFYSILYRAYMVKLSMDEGVIDNELYERLVRKLMVFLNPAPNIHYLRKSHIP